MLLGGIIDLFKRRQLNVRLITPLITCNLEAEAEDGHGINFTPFFPASALH